MTLEERIDNICEAINESVIMDTTDFNPSYIDNAEKIYAVEVSKLFNICYNYCEFGDINYKTAARCLFPFNLFLDMTSEEAEKKVNDYFKRLRILFSLNNSRHPEFTDEMKKNMLLLLTFVEAMFHQNHKYQHIPSIEYCIKEIL